MADKNAEEFELPGYHLIDPDLPLGEAFPTDKVRKVIDMELEPLDVVVASYPKTGTTFLQEVVWLIRNNGDTELANKTVNVARIPFMELGRRDNFKIFAELPRPRHMKTHLPYRYLPKSAREGKNKVVYIIRNPKDCLVSYYHFYRMSSSLGNFNKSWSEYFTYFLNSGAMLEFGNPMDHFKGYWQHRNDDHVCIVFYEDMVRFPHENVRKIARFLERELDEDVIEKIVQATKFDTMKKNPITNMNFATSADSSFNPDISPFMRKGKVGNWKEYFTEHESKVIDDMVRERLGNLDIPFTYE